MTDRRGLVVDWLRQQGYGLEYGVARTLRQDGYSVVRGRVYQDPQPPEEWRDIDIDAIRPADFMTFDDRPLIFHLVIECKYSEASWVVLADEPPTDATLLLGDAPDAVLARALSEAFPAGAVDGFMIKSTGKRDSAWEALNQVIKGAAAVAGRSDYYGGSSWDIVLPVVVTSASLFAVTYAEDGAETLLDRQQARLAVWSQVSHSTPTIVDVVSRDAFPDYLRWIHGELDTLAQAVTRLRRGPWSI